MPLDPYGISDEQRVTGKELGVLVFGTDGTRFQPISVNASGQLVVAPTGTSSVNLAQYLGGACAAGNAVHVRNVTDTGTFIGHAVDASAGAGPGGFVAVVQRRDSLIAGGWSGSISNLDYTGLLSDANGRLWCRTAIQDGAGTSLTSTLVGANQALDVNVVQTVGGAGGDGAILDGVDAGIKATVLDYANSNPVAVRLTDTSGDYVVAGGGVQYDDGDARGSATGTLIMGDDTTNIQAIHVDTDGNLQVDVLSITGTVGVTQSTSPWVVSGTVTANQGGAPWQVQSNSANIATETTLAALAAEDFATETTLAALAAEDFATETTLAALAAEDFATETTLAALAAEDFATETTLALINTSTTDIKNVIGTDGAAGPTKAVSVAGTQSTGELQELRVDANGELQVDVLSMPTVAVTGPLTDAELRATPVPVSGPLTDTELRATPVPVSGTVTIGTFPDNEPFDVAQYGGVAVGAGNAFYVRPGTSATFAVGDGTDTVDVETATSYTSPNLDEKKGFVTHALVSARESATVTKGMTMEEDQDRDAGDAADAGMHVSDIVKCNVITPTNVSTTYDDSPTTATSASWDTARFRYFSLSYALTKANTPTDIVIQVQVSPDDTNWRDLDQDFWQDLRYDDVAVGSGINRAHWGMIIEPFMRIYVVATGTTASNTFTIADLKVSLKN